MNLPVYDTIEIEFNLETTKFKTHGRTFLPTARRSSENELTESHGLSGRREMKRRRRPPEIERWRVRCCQSETVQGSRGVTPAVLPRHCHSQFSRSLWSLRGLFSQTAIQTIYSVFAFVLFFSTLIVHKPIGHQRRKELAESREHAGIDVCSSK